MYWVNAILILTSTVIMPSLPDNTDFDSFYDHSKAENTDAGWVGWIAWILYLVVVTYDTFVQLYFDECLVSWKEWALIEMVTAEQLQKKKEQEEKKKEKVDEVYGNDEGLDTPLDDDKFEMFSGEGFSDDEEGLPIENFTNF